VLNVLPEGVNVNNVEPTNRLANASGKTRSPAKRAVTRTDKPNVNAGCLEFIGEMKISTSLPSCEYTNREACVHLGCGKASEGFDGATGFWIQV
jgi:hypothetical protein